MSINRGNFSQYLLFFIWPFAMLLYAIKNFRYYWASNIFWLFTIFFGFTYVIIGNESDASRYKDQLVTMSNSNFNIQQLFLHYMEEGGSELDIAQRLLTFIISKFTEDFRILFAFFGFFMGYFISRYIWLIINKFDRKLDFFTGLLLISYSLVIGIWDMGGIRWNIAATIFVFSVLNYLDTKDRKYLWIAASTIFVHWSFPIALAVLLFYFIIGNRSLIYFVLFMMSFLISQINLDIFRDFFTNYAPYVVQESRGSYLDQGYVDLLADESGRLNWYVTGHREGLKWFIFLSVIYLYIKGVKSMKNNAFVFSVFNFAIFFYSIFNILSSIPSVHRFLNIGSLLILACIILYTAFLKNNFPQWIKLISVPILILYITVRVRTGFDFFGIWTIIGNPLLAIFVENEVPLIDIVKGLF
ncbi:MAG: EpsG family protein [Lentimicrobium sp.]